MAIVGEAHVIVRAITNRVRPDIQRAFNDRGIDNIGVDAGRRIGDGIGRGLSRAGGSGGFFDGLSAQASAARAQFDSLIRLAYTLGPALAGIVGAVSSLVGAFSALAATVAGAIPSLSVIPGLLANIAIAGGTLKLAFAGVGAAISAGMKQATSGAGGAAAAARDLSAELRRLRDAERQYAKAVADGEEAFARATERKQRALTRLAEAQESARQRLVEAEQDVANAITEGAAAVEEARARLADVERSTSEDIYDAKKKVYEAQVDLNEAYAKAREEIDQLNFAAEDAAINEKRAALELEKARETLLRVQDLPPNSRARREAELAFAQADLNYRKAIDTNKDMAKEQDRLAKEGVDGTKTVQDAKKKLADASLDQARTEAEAARKIQDANADISKAILEAIQDEQQARADLAAEQTRWDREKRDAAWELQDIERQFADEQERINESIANAKRNLKRAEEDLAKARKKGGAAGAGAANAYQQALAKLAPAQRKFVEYMVNTFIPSIDKLKAAAGAQFFPKLIPALENLRVNLLPALVPLLEATGGKLGDVATSISNTLTNPQVVSNIEGVWNSVNTSILPSLEKIAANAITGLTGFLNAAQPLVERFVGWIESVSETFADMFDSESDQAAFTEFLQKSGDIAAAIGDIFGNVFGGLGAIIKSQMEPGSGGWTMLEWLRQATEGFESFATSDSGMQRIEEFFNNTVKNAKPILGFIGDLVKEFLKLGENPNIGGFFQSLRDSDIAGTLGDIANIFIDAGPAIANFVDQFLQFTKATMDSEAINTFWDTLSFILEKLVSVFENPVVQQILPIIGSIAAAGVALRTAWAAAKIPILAIGQPLLVIANGLKMIPFKRFFGDAKAFIQLVGEGAGIVGKLRNFAMLVGPQGLVIAAIAGLIAIFVAMWNESETFREAIKKLVEGVIQKAVTIFENLKKKLDDALEPLGGMTGLVDGLKEAFKFLGDIVGTYVIPFFEMGLKNALDIIGAVLGTIIDIIGNVIEAFSKIFEGIKEGDVKKVFEGIVQAIFGPFEALWTNLVDLFKNIWNNVVEAVKSVLGIASPSKVFTDIAGAIFDAIVNVIMFLPNKFIEFFTEAWTKITDFITNVIGPFLLGIGETIAGWLVSAWDGLLDTLETVWNRTVDFFNNTIGGYLKGLWNTVTGWLKKVWDGYLSVLKTVWTTVKSFFTEDIATWLKGLGTKVKNWVKGAWDGLMDALNDAYDKIKDFFGSESPIAKFIKGLKDKISQWAGSIWAGLTSGLSSAMSTIKGFLRPLRTIINTMIRGANAVVGALSLGRVQIPEIPAFARGGVVYPRSGGVLATVAEAGRPERIEPLDENGLSQRDKAMIDYLSGGVGGGGATINVYSQPGMDEMQLAKIVSREISFMMRKGSV